LAYGLPILNFILSNSHNRLSKKSNKRRQLSALILAPTRELALQVMNHLKACIETPPSSSKEEGSSNSNGSSTKGPPAVSIAAIVGGMSAQKQRRLLDRGVDVLVATPGRLWDILGEVSHAKYALMKRIVNSCENVYAGYTRIVNLQNNSRVCGSLSWTKLIGC
jgi:ATP-dependent RNA helicase DDX24/MAK5